MTTAEPTEPASADDSGEGRPLITALDKLVSNGTLTQEQAQAVRQAVREARHEHRGERRARKKGA